MAVFQYITITLYLSAYFYRECSAKLAPDFIHPCETVDPECLTKATQDALPEFVKGIPELDIPVMDPFFIKELSMDLPGAFKFTYIDGKVSGFRKCVVNNVTAKIGTFMNLDFRCNITIKGKYKADGRVLLFPINGEGDAKIKLTNLHIKMYIKTKLQTDEQGVHHIGQTGYTYDVDYGDKVTFQLTNLFKESPQLSQTVVDFLNSNWRLVVGEFGKPLLDYSVDLAVKTVEKFFLKVPYEETILIPYVEPTPP